MNSSGLRVTNSAPEATAAPPEVDPIDLGRGVLWVGIMAGGVACGMVLFTGISLGVPLPEAIIYGALALLYLALTLSAAVSIAWARWIWRRLWAYLLLMGIIATALQALSGEQFLQPIIFTIPIIHAALIYSQRRAAAVCVLYLGLMNLGIWLSGEHHLLAMLYPTIGYTTLMILIVAFTRLSVEQARARRRADDLARDLARERNELARLSQLTATLTHDLDLASVLAQVASAGRALAGAAQARVWLREQAEEGDTTRVRLAAAEPPEPPIAREVGELWGIAALQRLEARADDGWLVLPLVAKGATIGALSLHEPTDGPYTHEGAQLLQPFAYAAGVAIENAILYEQARLSATLAERNRLARELHDTIAQGLTAVTMQLEAAQRGFERDPARARARLGRAHELARETLEDVRRSVWTLAAPLTDGQALGQALEELTRRFAERSGLPASYRHQGGTPALGHAAATQVLRVAQEALQNVEKHAQATAVEVLSTLDDGELRVQVRDNGVGFDPAALAPNGSGAASGFGLLSLRERARLAGGALRVESAPGAGTTIAITVPNARPHTREAGER